MLTIEQEWVLQLLRKSLRNSTETISTPADTDTVTGIIRRNGVLATVYPNLPTALKNALQKQYFAAINLSVQQNHIGSQALKALSGAGMNCIALKGWELRNLYPEPTMRAMVDLDILISPYHFARIKDVMAGLGCSAGSESSWKHDSFKKGSVHFEMHKRLTDDSGRIGTWEKELWDRAVKTEDNIYRMSPEDFYVFHFIHLHKDFMNGSLGLRRIADTWLLQKWPVDVEAVQNLLGSFNLLEFHNRMVKLGKATMGEEPIDDGSEILLKHAFAHGLFGSGKSYKAGRIVSMGKSIKSGKRKSRLAAVFPSYKRMKAQFPVLSKWPILLPVCWLRRIFGLLKDGMKHNWKMLDYSDVSEEDYAEMKRFFEAGGV